MLTPQTCSAVCLTKPLIAIPSSPFASLPPKLQSGVHPQQPSSSPDSLAQKHTEDKEDREVNNFVSGTVLSSIALCIGVVSASLYGPSVVVWIAAAALGVGLGLLIAGRRSIRHSKAKLAKRLFRVSRLMETIGGIALGAAGIALLVVLFQTIAR